MPGVPRLRHGDHREQVGGQGRGQHQTLGGMVLRGTHMDGGDGDGIAAGPGGHRGQGAGRRQKPRRVARWGRGCCGVVSCRGGREWRWGREAWV